MYCASSHHTGAGSPLPRRAKPGASTNWLMTRIYPQKKGLCQPVLMKLYLESNSFTNWVLFFDFDFELNLNSINKVLPVLVTICGSFDLLDFTVHTFDGTI